MPVSDHTSCAEQQIDEMILRDDSFAEIEQYVDRQPVPDDEKAALWMLAWSRCLSHPVRRKLLCDAVAEIREWAAVQRENATALRAQSRQLHRRTRRLAERISPPRRPPGG